MTAAEYLRDRRGQLLLHFISMAALSAFLYWTGTASGVLVIMTAFWIIGLSCCLIVRYYKINARLREFDAVMKGLDKKYLFAECVSKPVDTHERRLFEWMRRAGKAMIEAVSDAESQRKEYREYIESWVHEIKAPITAAQLVCDNHKTEQSRKLSILLTQIEEHVERALYYARAGSVEKDFIIRETPLAAIVRDAITKHQTLLIHSGVRVEAEDVSGAVYTDGKWVSFMLGQCLSNAIRYRKDEPVIRLASVQAGDAICLTITDNGAGIPKDELPRIFERGFTGSNGRAKGQSTGMGLYICKKLADFLQIKLEAASVQGEYTTISLTFPAKLAKV